MFTCLRRVPVALLVGYSFFEFTVASVHAQVTTALNSGSGVAGHNVVLAITANKTGSVEPAALQWTLKYQPADVAAISLALGSAAYAAAKTLACSASGSTMRCLVAGINQNEISNGPIALATVQLATAPADQSIPITISNTVAADANGNDLANAAAGATITVIPQTPQVGLVCTPTVLYTPTLFSCEVSVSSPYPTNLALGLTSNNVAVHLPASVSIPAGSSTANVTGTSSIVSATQDATLAVTGSSNAPSVTVTLLPSCSSDCSAIAVNAGGPEVEGFKADRDYRGGSTYATKSPIETSSAFLPAPEAVYQSERFGNFMYTLPHLKPGATYMVRLHFAEIYWSKVDQRVFNVSINGTPVLTNFDIIKTAGARDRAIVENFKTRANASGQILIQFQSIVNYAKISGIEVSQ